MKRIISLALSVILLVAFCAGAAAESLTMPFETTYYTMMLPEGWEIYDPDTEDDTDTFQTLGYFSSPDDRYIWANCYLHYLEDWKDVSLWNVDDEELEGYIDATMSDFEDDDGEFLGLVYAGSIPFVMIKARDEDGEYIYADTMTNGYVILFYVYLTELDTDETFPFSDADIDQLTAIIETFTPKG